MLFNQDGQTPCKYICPTPHFYLPPTLNHNLFCGGLKKMKVLKYFKEKLLKSL